MPKKKPADPAAIDDYFAQLANIAEETKDKGGWMEDDYSGQLAVDVYQTEKAFVIRAAIAGVRPEDLDVSVNRDMVTIKGMRRLEETIPEEDFLYQECYWGGFSRSIILPSTVDADHVKAALKNGILRVTLPKIERSDSGTINVVSEDEEA